MNSEGKLLAVESHLSLELGKGSVLEPGNHFDVVVRRCLVAVADNHPFGNTKVVLTAVVGAAVVPSMGFVVDQVVDSVRYIGLHRQLSHHKVGYWAFFALELQDEWTMVFLALSQNIEYQSTDVHWGRTFSSRVSSEEIICWY